MPKYQTTTDLKTWKRIRQECRVNLVFLAREILSYTDIDAAVHGPIIDALQKFQGGSEPNDTITLKDGCGYKPKVPMWELQGPRKNLILFPRGHLKTTVVSIAHTIQWIINYSDVRILISMATGDQTRDVLGKVKAHFQFNELFRSFFPEFCPQGKNVKEFGNQDSFTVPCRATPREDHTLSTCTVGSVIAGGHFDVNKHDDLVDKENIRTPEQIFTVNQHFGYMWPLVETNELPPFHGWVDVVGTRYSFADLYGTILKGEEDLPPEHRTWHVVEVSAAPNWPDGPALWPKRCPMSRLKEIENDPLQGPWILSSQYLLKPIPDKSGLVSSEDELVWMPRKALDELYAHLSLHATIDLAGMEPSTNKRADNDYTCINVHGFGRDGRAYVIELHHSRNFTPHDVIELMFTIWKRHPRLTYFKIEKDAHARVLLPFLKREMVKRGIFLPVLEIQRDNRTSKQQRIKGLQPWFQQRSIVFAADLAAKSSIIREVMYFPKYDHDDILDTLADMMQGRDGSVTSDVMPLAKRPPDYPEPPLGARHLGKSFWGIENDEAAGVDSRTGW